VKLGVAGYLLHHVFTPLEVVVVRPPTMAGPESLMRGSLSALADLPWFGPPLEGEECSRDPRWYVPCPKLSDENLRMAPIGELAECVD
jgi:hypothetical protein